MCLAVPGKVKEIDNNIAVVDVLGVTKRIAIDLVKDVKVGDYLLIHTGCAIDKIDEEEAKKTLEIFKELGDIL